MTYSLLKRKKLSTQYFSAVALGLTADDYLALEQFTEELKYRRAEAMAKLGAADQIGLGQQLELQIGRETVKDQSGVLKNIYEENKDLKTKIERLTTENVSLIQGLKEIQSQIGSGTDGVIHVPALESLLTVQISLSVCLVRLSIEILFSAKRCTTVRWFRRACVRIEIEIGSNDRSE